jgi:transcriptional regulator with XRE-family HTH domain
MTISGNQLKAARALAQFDQQTLANQAGVGVNTVRNMEAAGADNIRARTGSLDAVVAALQAAGVEFTNGGEPGVKLVAVSLPKLPGRGVRLRRGGGDAD